MRPDTALRLMLARHLGAVEGERLVLVCDADRWELGQRLVAVAQECGLWTRCVLLRPKMRIVRRGPPPHLKQVLALERPDMFVNLLSPELQEAPFRQSILSHETRHHARVLHGPGASLSDIQRGPLDLGEGDYRRMERRAGALIAAIGDAHALAVDSGGGATLATGGKEGRLPAPASDCSPGWPAPYPLRLPAGEVVIPLGRDCSGRAAVAAVPGLSTEGKMSLEFRGGREVEVACGSKAVERRLRSALSHDAGASACSALSISVNPHSVGEVRLGFGRNLHIPGGRNFSASYFEVVLAAGTVRVTRGGREDVLVENGKLSQ